MPTVTAQDFVNTILRFNTPVLRMRGYAIYEINRRFVSFACHDEQPEYLFTHETLDKAVDVLAQHIYAPETKFAN